jgi:glucose-6-phosphate dehydrogenase assembly protein OpcA
VSVVAGQVADIWSERDTNPDAIDEALRRLLHERHKADGRLVAARVLNLVVVVDRDWKGETANRLERVGRYHASRTVLCSVDSRPPLRTTIDARALLSYEEPKGGGTGLMRERVEIDLGPEHLRRLDTIVDPVLVSELPTVLWCPHGHEDALIAMRHRADVILTDSDELFEPTEALSHAAALLESAYVVDLAWLRTTPWRERLAASFNSAARRASLRRAAGLSIDHRQESRASALLLAGWLASRLGWEVSTLTEASGGQLNGNARRVGGELAIRIAPSNQQAPGLGSVAIACDGEHPIAISLNRAPGGLHATESYDNGTTRSWQVLGASRGEGGILGEGVRQALLRDITYGPALAAARELSPV